MFIPALSSPRYILLSLTVLLVPMMFVACGGDDDGAGAGGPSSELRDLADAAEKEFADRGEGTFIDTGFQAYCRQGQGATWDGPFAVMGFKPDDDAEYCYNVSGDLMAVALGVRESFDDPAECMVLDGSSGTVVRSEVTESEGCLP
ncbi:MAG: hypothetical protein R3C29_08900 [Dehalococcoidia bacterium]